MQEEVLQSWVLCEAGVLQSLLFFEVQMISRVEREHLAMYHVVLKVVKVTWRAALARWCLTTSLPFSLVAPFWKVVEVVVL